jgi:hypothetical protein
MRVGQNPAKSVKKVAKPAKVTVAVVSYIPTLGGYYAQSLDVLKVCLNSIWENTNTPYDLLVFDNASCTEVKSYLREAHETGKIQYLVLSDKNYGKSGAWNFIFGAAPGDYIAYADSDVYHHPGWLQAQLAVLDQFPGVGMVTGMPMWTPETYSTATTKWAEQADGITLQRGRYLAWEDYWRHSRSLGADESKARAHYETTENLVIDYQGEQYYIGAAHFQFVSPKRVLAQLLPIPADRPMGQVRNLDIALNQRGYHRLCTSQWWVRHMGNTLEEEYLSPSLQTIPKTGKGFWQLRIPRRLVTWLYHKSFEILYRNPKIE